MFTDTAVTTVLLLADTHLGLDLPLRPRIERRRRGPDFFRNTEMALQYALDGRADLVVHGGDLLYRSKVGAWMVHRAVAPLVKVAEAGVPVVLVPGNHDRSRIPYPLLAAHENLHLIDRPKTLGFGGVSVSGFPCVRRGVRDSFSSLLKETGHEDTDAPVKLLAMHQTVEGASVGPVGYTFRRGPDVIRGRDIPGSFAAVLAGHIHRHQVLEWNSPVFYPGAVERTAFAEKDERKGFLLLRFGNGGLMHWEFRELPTRPMVDVELDASCGNPDAIATRLRELLDRLDPDAVVRLKPVGEISESGWKVLQAASLRRLAPPTMTLSVGVARSHNAVAVDLRHRLR